jgi:hypothetical protein
VAQLKAAGAPENTLFVGEGGKGRRGRSGQTSSHGMKLFEAIQK